jgi:hypothetical protein
MNQEKEPKIVRDEVDPIKKEIKRNLKWSSDRSKEQKGGQQCGIPLFPTILESEELQVKIQVGCYRSQMRNKELAYALFELALDELTKNSKKMNQEKAKEFLEEKEEFRYVNNLAERVKIPWYTIIKRQSKF